MRFRLPRLVLFDEYGLEAHTIRSLKLVILAVAFGIVQFNIVSGIAMAGYLRALGVSDFLFGLLFAIGPMLSPLQLFASFVLEKTRKRKQMMLTAGLIQRIVWLPFGLVPFFVPLENLTLRIWMVALFMIISAFGGPFMNVSFHSLMADLVPEHIRGRYFAMRVRVFTVCGIIGGIFTAWILDNFDPFYSYAIVFSMATILGSADILCFLGVKYPALEKPEGGGESFFKMLSTVLKNKPYMKFTLFITMWIFSLSIAGPFFLVHMQEGVLLSNTTITIAVQILPNIFSVLFVSYWGRTLDTHGNKPVMQMASGLLCFVPFLWVFTNSSALSVAFIMMIGMANGLLFPAFDLGANNMMLGHAPKVNRSMYLAVYLTVTSIAGIGLGNATGGWLLENVFSTFEARNLSLFNITFTRFNYLFALSAMLRVVMVYVALPRMLSEQSKISAWELFHTVKRDINPKNIIARRCRLR